MEEAYCRDVPPAQLPAVTASLGDWLASAAAALASIEQRVEWTSGAAAAAERQRSEAAAALEGERKSMRTAIELQVRRWRRRRSHRPCGGERIHACWLVYRCFLGGCCAAGTIAFRVTTGAAAGLLALAPTPTTPLPHAPLLPCLPQAQADSAGMLMDDQDIGGGGSFSLSELTDVADGRPAPAAGRHTKRRR